VVRDLQRVELGFEDPGGIEDVRALVREDLDRMVRVLEAIKDLKEQAKGEG
jgi:hypothetical protein